MTGDRFQLVDALFREALTHPPGDRPGFVRGCTDDTSIRRELTSLLDADQSAHPLLDQDFDALAPGSPDAGPQVVIPDTIGPYRVKGVLGRGGMGVVYRAHQQNPDRDIALKVLRPGLVSASVIRRFRHEAGVLGRLQHPGIAQIFGAGTADDGQPYFAMELIDGMPLLKYASAHDLTLHERINILIQVCDAISHAHQRGVIHRDLKPANILVTQDNQRHHARVLDFGVARAIDPEFRQTTLQTSVGELVGTLAYMSPEQVAGDPRHIDARSDVYALGVVGYELMCGTLPIDVRGRPLPDAVRMITADQPVPLSNHNRACRGDLDTVIHAALDRDPAARYQSASELAADLRRIVADVSIVMQPERTVHRLIRFARRNRGLVAGVAVLLAGLSAAAAISTIMYQRAEARAVRLERAGYAQRILLGASAFAAADSARLRELLDGCPEHLRHWEWRRLDAQSDDSVMTLADHEGTVTTLAFSPDGTTLYSASVPRGDADRGGANAIRVWDLATGTCVHTLIDDRGPVRDLALSPDGTELYAAGGSWPGWTGAHHTDVRVWNLATRTVARNFTVTGHDIHTLSFTDDDTIAIGGKDTTIALAHGDTGKVESHLSGFGSTSQEILIAGDGSTLFMANWDGSLYAFDLTRGEVETIYAGSAPALCLALSPDGSLIAAGSTDRSVRVWNRTTGDLVRVIEGHTADVREVEFAADDLLVTASHDQTVRTWDPRTGAPLGIRRGARSPIVSMTVRHDGARIAAGTRDGNILIWSTEGSNTDVTLAHTADVNDAVWRAGSSEILTAGDDRTVGVWSLPSGAQLARWTFNQYVYAIAVSPDESLVAVGLEDGTLVLLDAAGNERVRWRAQDWYFNEIAWSDDGSMIATAADDLSVRVWSTADQSLLYRAEQPLRTMGLEFIGQQLYALSARSLVQHDPRQQREVRRLEVSRWEGTRLARSPDGRYLVSGDRLGVVHMIDAETLTIRTTFSPFSSRIYGLSYSPDNQRLLVASQLGTLKLLDTGTGDTVMQHTAHDAPIYRAHFSPDGRSIVSTSQDDTARVLLTERRSTAR